MKLRNKKTGKIDNFIFEVIKDRIDLYKRVGHSETEGIYHYNSLAELNKNWEDVPEEPKEYWYIGDSGEVWGFSHYYLGTEIEETHREICNLFETREEAEKAVEKLKAWKRLKDKGFRFNCWYGGSKDISFSMPQEIIDKTTAKDLDLLFGGEE